MLPLVLAARGGGETADTVAAGSSEPPTTAGAASDQSSDPATPTTAEEPSDEPAPSSAPGEITLTIGDEIWQFDGALCAYINAAPGEAGSEWNVSRKQVDLQAYVSVDSYGSQVSITDVVNYGSFEWVAENEAVTLNVNENDITAEGTFSDMVDEGQATDGTLMATCPDWFEG